MIENKLDERKTQQHPAHHKTECPVCRKPLEAIYNDEDELRAYQCNTEGCGYYEQFE